MIVELLFDQTTKALYVPDGYIHNVEEIQSLFLDWMKTQSDCIYKTNDKFIAYRYDERHFLRFVNENILINTREKAYFISHYKKYDIKLAF